MEVTVAFTPHQAQALEREAARLGVSVERFVGESAVDAVQRRMGERELGVRGYVYLATWTPPLEPRTWEEQG